MSTTLARILSYLGHPLLVLTYILLILLAINPYAFGVRTLGDRNAMLLLISVFSTSFLLPGFGVALMKPLGLIQSLEMPDKMERIGPYIIAGVFYLWLFKNLASAGSQYPNLFTVCVLGATIGLFLAFLINIFTKISAHATGMGGMVAMLLLTAFTWGGSSLYMVVPGGGFLISGTVVLALGLLFAGAVGVARLALGAHTPVDLYRGYAAGFGAVLLANFLV
ncbi:MAG: hypothetical protein ABIO24_04175 [Saprospiraceae bacterium]